MKKRKVIYRIENKKEVGPYRSDYVEKWRFRSHSGKRHPTVWEDFKRKDASKFTVEKWNCGFNSKRQLTKWFNKSEVKRLLTLGFKIVKIQPRKLIKGKKQVIFKGRYKTSEVSFSELNF